MNMEFEPYVADKSLPPAFIFDIDGTLAHIYGGAGGKFGGSGRSPYDYSRVLEDIADDHVVELLMILSNEANIILVSGRKDVCYSDTSTWLIDEGIIFDDLFMRNADDVRPDDIVKYEIFNEHIAHKYNVRGVFDDRDKVVAMWRKIGLKTYQVNYGDF